MNLPGNAIFPAWRGPIQYEHYHRQFCSPRRCAKARKCSISLPAKGTGSAVLAQSAKSVVGVDIDAQAVENARKRYGEQPNLRYEHGSATAIPLLRRFGRYPELVRNTPSTSMSPRRSCRRPDVFAPERPG